NKCSRRSVSCTSGAVGRAAAPPAPRPPAPPPPPPPPRPAPPPPPSPPPTAPPPPPPPPPTPPARPPTATPPPTTQPRASAPRDLGLEHAHALERVSDPSLEPLTGRDHERRQRRRLDQTREQKAPRRAQRRELGHQQHGSGLRLDLAQEIDQAIGERVQHLLL